MYVGGDADCPTGMYCSHEQFPIPVTQSIITLRLLLSVRVSVCAYEREVTGSHSTQGKEVIFLASVDLDVTTDSPLTWLAVAPAATKVISFKRTVGQNYIQVYTYIRWPGERKERHSGVDVVRRCFPGGGNFILSAFSWEPLRANLQDYQRVSLAR